MIWRELNEFPRLGNYLIQPWGKYISIEMVNNLSVKLDSKA